MDINMHPLCLSRLSGPLGQDKANLSDFFTEIIECRLVSLIYQPQITKRVGGPPYRPRKLGQFYLNKCKSGGRVTFRAVVREMSF